MSEKRNFDAKIGSIPVTAEMRNHVEEIAQEQHLKKDDIVRRALRFYILRWHRYKAKQLSRQR